MSDKVRTKTFIKSKITQLALERASLDYKLGEKTDQARARISELSAKIDALRWVLGQIDLI